MRASQWVAFDASTDKPHKCGKKNKEDPNIKELAKQKIKIETEGIDLGYSDLEINNEKIISEEKINDINLKIDETYNDSANTPPKVDEKYKKEKIDIIKEEPSKIVKEEPTIKKTTTTEDKPLFGLPGTFSYYFWRGVVIFWIIMLLNGLLFGPFD